MKKQKIFKRTLYFILTFFLLTSCSKSQFDKYIDILTDADYSFYEFSETQVDNMNNELADLLMKIDAQYYPKTVRFLTFRKNFANVQNEGSIAQFYSKMDAETFKNYMEDSYFRNGLSMFVNFNVVIVTKNEVLTIQLFGLS
jgi:hypothetical protein